MTDQHTMTNEEIDRWWAERMGAGEYRKYPEDCCQVCGWPLYESIEEGCTRDSCCERPIPKKPKFSPSTSWADFGVVYEWMRRRGWRFAAWPAMEDENSITACWTRPLRMSYSADDPDILRASLLAGMKAENTRLREMIRVKLILHPPPGDDPGEG